MGDPNKCHPQNMCSANYYIFSKTLTSVTDFYGLSEVQAGREIVNDTNAFLYTDCRDPGCNCCLQVTDCLGFAFVHPILQITPKVKIYR